MTAAKTIAEVLTEHAFHLIEPVDLDDVNGPCEEQSDVRD